MQIWVANKIRYRTVDIRLVLDLSSPRKTDANTGWNSEGILLIISLPVKPSIGSFFKENFIGLINVYQVFGSVLISIGTGRYGSASSILRQDGSGF